MCDTYDGNLHTLEIKSIDRTEIGVRPEIDTKVAWRVAADHWLCIKHRRQRIDLQQLDQFLQLLDYPGRLDVKPCYVLEPLLAEADFERALRFSRSARS